MPSIADPLALEALVRRLQALRPDTPRRWGTLTASEMLCHLGDAQEYVLGMRTPPGQALTGRSRPVLKWLALRALAHWPKGARTRPGVDPKREGTRPSSFEEDRRRAIRSLQMLAAAEPTTVATHHFRFGPMSLSDWHRWAYRHVEHHLRQFGM
jgi:hypothetical protein